MNLTFWNGKRVFITGHTGFKGGWLCIFLNYLGAEVTGYSLKPATKPSLFYLANIKKIIKKSIIGDVRDYKKLNYEIEKSKCTILFHLAAQPLVRLSYEEPKKTFETNFIGSLNILEAIKTNSRIKTSILITSDKVYDITKNKIFKETDSLSGIDPYSSSKVCIEFMFYSYIKSFFSKQDKQMVATVRAGNVIGGGDYSKDRLVPDIYDFHKKNKKIIIRSPNAVRPWQHVLEPLSGYLCLAQEIHKNKIKKQTQNWNFGPDLSSCKTVKFVTSYLAKTLNLKIIYKNNKKSGKLETNVLRLSNKKSKKFINWYPRWNLTQSLDKIIDWNKKIKYQRCLYICQNQIRDFLNS
jgi:CDP-glucose 4,6-dehydratase